MRKILLLSLIVYSRGNYENVGGTVATHESRRARETFDLNGHFHWTFLQSYPKIQNIAILLYKLFNAIENGLENNRGFLFCGEKKTTSLNNGEQEGTNFHSNTPQDTHS